MLTTIAGRLLAPLLLVTAFAVGCGDDSPSSPSPVTSTDVAGSPVQTFGADPFGHKGSPALGGPTGGLGSRSSGYALDGPAGESAGPGPVTNLTAVQAGCPTDTPINVAEIRWNPPTTGAAAASYAVEHYGSAPPQYIWMPGEEIPASYAPWAAGHCAVEAGTTLCVVSFDGMYGTHRFSVRPRTGPDEVNGQTTDVTVTIGDCPGSVAVPDTASPPGAVRTLRAWQVSGTLNVLVSWDTPEAQSGVDAPTSYTLTGDGGSATLPASACTAARGRPNCGYTFEELGTGSWTFNVAAVNGDGAGTASSATATVEELPTPASVPGPVDALSATQQGTTQQVTISWMPSATGSPVSYAVTIDGRSSASVRASSSCSTATCSVSYSSLAYGDHTVTVAGVNPSGTGSSVELAFAVVAPALTAAFSGVPAAHNGEAFSFTLTFSVNPKLGFRALRDQALSVSQGGEVSRVRRHTRGSSQVWEIYIAPTVPGGAAGSLIINLSASTNCGTFGAICTADGQALAHAVSATVPR